MRTSAGRRTTSWPHYAPRPHGGRGHHDEHSGNCALFLIVEIAEQRGTPVCCQVCPSAAQPVRDLGPSVGHRTPWRYFARHFAEMVAAMVVGMVVLGLALKPVLGLSNVFQRADLSALVMATNMTIGMSAWMRYRGHSWVSIAEMGPAMYLPFAVLLVPFWAGSLPGHGDHDRWPRPDASGDGRCDAAPSGRVRGWARALTYPLEGARTT